MDDIQQKELEKIRRRCGGVLRPRDVVDTARNEKNPLHDMFEWDDSVAAEAFRRHQARQIIVKVTYAPQKDAEPIQVYVSVSTDRDEDGGGYRRHEDVRADDAMYQTYLNDIFKEFERFKRKFEYIKALGPVLRAHARFEKKHRAEAGGSQAA
jgi:hypothetical protein